MTFPGQLPQRRPSNVAHFSAEEIDIILSLSYQAFDWLIDLIARGSATQLAGFVADPESFAEHRSETAVVAQEAIPIYLHDTSVTKPGDAVGASRRGKDRLTMIMRQALRGMWDEAKAEPTGHILDSVLLVHASHHGRLEDMSHTEPSVWLRNVVYEVDGALVEHKKGERVGPFLAPWRETRRKSPYLFYRNHTSPMSEWKPGKARLWTQEKATKDSIIASWLAELIEDNGIKQCLKSVSCVASEHTPHMETKNYLSQQIVHCIGMRQTAATQVTHVRFARIGKRAGEARRRRLDLTCAWLTDKPTKLLAQQVGLMRVALDMHDGCVRDNQESDGVLKAFRSAGWLAYRPTAAGLKHYTGAFGAFPARHPLGSSRLTTAMMDKRFSWVSSDGVPKKPDWNDLKQVRERQAALTKNKLRKLVKEVGPEAARMECVPNLIKKRKRKR